MYTHTQTHMYMYIYTHTHRHTHTHIYAHTRTNIYFVETGCCPVAQVAWYLLCSPGWPQTHDPHASDSRVLGLQACTIMPG
jgi:hypothetical protein